MKKGLLTISLDDHVLKLMYAQTKPAGWKVRGLEVEEIAGRSEEDLISIIKDKLHKLKIKLFPAVLIIPRGVVTVRYLQLPTSDPKELKNMVDIQVVRQIPYSREEMVYDYQILGPTKEGYTEVLLVIVHRDVISRYIRILEKAGVKPSTIELNSLAIVQMYRFINSIQKDKDKKISPDVPVAIIDIDYASTNILVLQKGVFPIFTRNISIGSMHLEGEAAGLGGKDWVGEWKSETNRSLEVYQRENAVKLKNLLIIGDINKRVISLMTEKPDINVSSWNLDTFVEGIALKDGVIKLKKAVVSISSLLGVIREGILTSVNLIPESVKIARHKTERKKSLLVTGLLLAGILGISGLTISKKIQDRRTYLDELEARLEETSPVAEELEVKRERLALIRDQLSVEGTSLDILRELYTIIPQKTSLTVFNYDDKLGVTIRGIAPAMSEVFGLIPKLEASPLFKSVTSRQTIQRKIKGKELTDFRIDCSIEVNREAG